jgi:hypothetical protein
MVLKKGSAAAKAFMAKLRASKGKTKLKTKAKTKIGGLKILSVTQFNNFAKLKKAKFNNEKQFIDFLFKYSKDLFGVISLKNKTYNDVYELNKKIADWISDEGFDIDDFEDYFIKKSKIGVIKKPAVKSLHKDTKSHNVNIRVLSGTEKNTERLEYGQIYDTYLQLYLVKFANLSFSLWAVTSEGLTKALKHPEGKNQAPIVYRVKSYGIPKFEKMTIKELKDFK